MQTSESTLSTADNNHHGKQEPSENLERLIATYKAEIGTGWEKVFAQTVKINIDYAD